MTYWKIKYQSWNGVERKQLVQAATAERAKAVFTQLSGITGRGILSIEKEGTKQ